MIYFDEKTSGIYDIVSDSKNECMDLFLERGNCSKELRKLIDLSFNIWIKNGKNKKENPFIFSKKFVEVKFNRFYRKDKTIKEFLLSLGIDVLKNSFHLGDQKIKWGNGSIGKGESYIPTNLQENFFSEIINDYFKNKKKITLDDLFYFESEINDWKKSWVVQFNELKSFLKDWKNVYSIRWGDDDEIGNEIVELHSILMKKYNVNKKDNINPSDIILYNKSRKKYILSKLRKIDKNSENLCEEMKEMFINFFDEKMLIGVSLKKVSKCIAKKVNFEPEKMSFLNTKVSEIKFCPLKDFFGKNENISVDDLRKNKLKMSFDDYQKLNLTKNCGIYLISETYDDEIVLNYRTNSFGFRRSMVCEPRFKKGKSFIGKAKITSVRKMISENNDEFKKVNKNMEYDLNDISEKWVFLKKNGIVDSECTKSDLKKLFKFFGKFEKDSDDSVLWSIYNQIHFLYSYLNSNDPDFFRKILMLSSKKNDYSMPFLLLESV